MKIIVDEMPARCEECIFIGYTNYECKIDGMHCGLYEGSCNSLKPITDFHAEKVIEKHDDGSCTVQLFDIR